MGIWAIHGGGGGGRRVITSSSVLGAVPPIFRGTWGSG